MFDLLLRPIDPSKIFIIIGIVAFIAIVFTILIVTVSKVCFVKTDERAENIASNLAGANCGGCGYAGCADFAKALSEGKAEISDCGPTSNEGKAEIAKILGIPFSGSEPMFAIVHCAGGAISKDKFLYVGNEGCKAQNLFLGGRKQCPSGCLGGGTCKEICPYHAIEIEKGVAFADKTLCEACGVCVKNCPKNIIELIPKSAKVYVACSTHCKGREVIDACSAGCISCGLCVKNCPKQAIVMDNGVPVIDYSKCSGCTVCVIKCPRKCIKLVKK